MNSPINFGVITISPGSTDISPTWDSVVSYDTYNIQLSSNTNLRIIVYQDSTPIPSTTTSVNEVLYTPSDKTLAISGELTNSRINYEIRNLSSTDTATVKFYVVYK